MTKQEFEERAGTQVTNQQYERIEYVYNYHPCISAVEGKDEIAQIYKLGGMRLIADMTETARAAQRLEDKEMNLRQQLQATKDRLEELRTNPEF